MSNLPSIAKDISDNGTVRSLEANTIMDAYLMKEFGQAMSLKMDVARSEGASGWFDEEVLNDEFLKDMIINSSKDHDWASVANYAAMLWGRDKIREAT